MPLLLPDLVVLLEVLIEMVLELLVADESHSAVGALELYAFVELGDCYNVEPEKIV